MRYLFLALTLSARAWAIDSQCTTTSNYSLYRCPEGSVDWWDSYTGLVDTLDGLGAGLTSAGALKSSSTLTGFNQGSILFMDGSSKINQNNANLYWDDTNVRLGIGTNAPAYRLHVASAAQVDGQLVVAGSSTFQSYAVFKGTSPWADVKAFGAKGDGITDDTTAIQAAINSIGTSEFGQGGVVYLPPGRYITTAALKRTSNAHNLTIRGAGRNASIIDSTWTASSPYAIEIGSNNATVQYTTIEDLGIKPVTKTAGGVHAINFRYLNIHRVFFGGKNEAGATGVALELNDDTVGSTFAGFAEITDSDFQAWSTGILIGSTTTAGYMSGNKFTGSSTIGAGAIGVRITSSSVGGWEIFGNQFEGWGTSGSGGAINTGGTQAAIFGNRFETCGNYCVKFTATRGTAMYSSVFGNQYIGSAGDGFVVTPSGTDVYSSTNTENILVMEQQSGVLGPFNYGTGATYSHGAVGIGGVAPTSAKVVVYDINQSTGSGNSNLQIQTTAYGNMDYGGRITFAGNTSTTQNPTIFAAVAGRKENNTDSNLLGYLQMSTQGGSGDVEQARITSSGLFGINKTAPSYRLDVAGDINADNSITGSSITSNAGMRVLGTLSHSGIAGTAAISGGALTGSSGTINGNFKATGNVQLGDATADSLDVYANGIHHASNTWVAGSTLAANGFIYIDKSTAAFLNATQASIGTSDTAITGSTVTLSNVSAGATVICEAHLPFLHATADGFAYVKWIVDGVQCSSGKYDASHETRTADDSMVDVYCIKTAVAAGSHTYSLMAAANANTTSMRGASLTAQLMCHEVH